MSEGWKVTNAGVSENSDSTLNEKSLSQNDLDSEDAKDLESMGYKQELARTLGTAMSFSFAYVAVGVIVSLTALYPSSILQGGPGVSIWSWIVVSIFSILTGLCMAGMFSILIINQL